MNVALNSIWKVTGVCLLSLVSLTSVAVGQQKSLVETAVAAGNFETLLTAAKAAGLVDALSTNEPLTIFAPTDDAFARVEPSTLQSLLEPANKDQLAAILTYHVVKGRVSASAAYGLRSANSLNGQRLNLDLQGEVPKINNAQIVATDIECSNGIIHVIDEVLLPASDSIPTTATNAGIFNTLLAAVGAADLGGVLSGPGPFTVFAPTDDAFAALPAGTVDSLLLPQNKQQLVNVLKYHVLAGRIYAADAVKAGVAPTLSGRSVKIEFSASGLKVNDATVVSKDIETSNGVVHAIDKVLLPGNQMAPTEAMSLLNDAIRRGVPVFNSGDRRQCAEIYQTVMQTLADTGIAGADDYTTSLISQTLSNAASSSDDTNRAWALRGGIDSLKNRLQSMQMNR